MQPSKLHPKHKVAKVNKLWMGCCSMTSTLDGAAMHGLPQNNDMHAMNRLHLPRISLLQLMLLAHDFHDLSSPAHDTGTITLVHCLGLARKRSRMQVLAQGAAV